MPELFGVEYRELEVDGWSNKDELCITEANLTSNDIADIAYMAADYYLDDDTAYILFDLTDKIDKLHDYIYVIEDGIYRYGCPAIKLFGLMDYAFINNVMNAKINKIIDLFSECNTLDCKSARNV